MTVTIGHARLMNTLATRHPASSLPREEIREAAPARGQQRQGSFFLLGSIALHAGLLVLFAAAPGPALALSPSEEVEIEFIEPPVELPSALPEPEPESALPLGKLDAPVEKTPIPLPTSEPPNPGQEAEQVLAAPAPELLASDNPYGASDTAVFTSGSTKNATSRVVKQVATSPAFGVEGGSARPDANEAKELRSWYARVQAELKRVGTRSYPRRALKLGQQGTAKVTVTIDESGNLLSASLAAGSGVASLDQAALQGVQSISKVSAPPPGSGTNRLTVPVTFRIN